MEERPAAVVRRGYDLIAERYLAERIAGVGGGPFAAFLGTAVAAIQEDGIALDLGCGAGEPVTAALASRARVVVGMDLSAAQLGLARASVPDGIFVQGDMTELGVRDGSLDAVVAFHSIIHVPRELHRIMFARIHRWLRPSGIFAARSASVTTPKSGSEIGWVRRCIGVTSTPRRISISSAEQASSSNDPRC